MAREVRAPGKPTAGRGARPAQQHPAVVGRAPSCFQPPELHEKTKPFKALQAPCCCKGTESAGRRVELLPPPACAGRREERRDGQGWLGGQFTENCAVFLS